MSKKDSVVSLKVDQIQPNPFQPRDKIKKEDLSELVESIKSYGILEPLVVAHTPAGYQLIAGERRWRAAKVAGLESVPVHVKKTTPRGMLEMAIIENVQREDLNALERAQAFKRLVQNFNLQSKEIAERIGKSPSYVRNTLKLLDLPDAIKDGLMGGYITEGHARAIFGIKDESLMIDCYKRILRENASVRRAEELSRRYKSEYGQAPSTRGRPIKQIDEQIDEWEENLQKHFKQKTKLKLIRSRNYTRITLRIFGDPEETQEDLDRILAKLGGIEKNEGKVVFKKNKAKKKKKSNK